MTKKRLAPTSLILPVWAVAGLVWVVASGFSEDVYMAGRTPRDMLPLVYPLQGVLCGCTALGVETLVAWGVLRPASYHRSWGRALIATAVLSPWCFYLLTGAMHQSPYYGTHLLWLLVTVLGLMLLTIVSLAASAWIFFKTRRANTQ